MTELWTAPLRDIASHRSDKGSRHERQMERGAREQIDGETRERESESERFMRENPKQIEEPEKIKFKVLMDPHSAFTPLHIWH